MTNLTQSRPARNPSAAAVFIAGLPELRRGRILTSGSDPDSWKRKSATIRERLARERIAHGWRAPL